MARITVLGGTGYAGGAIVADAITRDHEVASYSRRLPEAADLLDGVSYEVGSMTDAAVRADSLSATDVLVAALSPRGDMAGRVRALYAALADEAADAGVRLVVIGGASALRPAAGEPTFAEAGQAPAAFAEEAMEMFGVLQDLQARTDELDWLFVSPARTFGSYAPGEATGHYRVGGDVVVTDDAGESVISGPDFGQAVVDEIESHDHTRQQITFAY
ncbi:NAD(P)-dependent oxidoreductase [Demequina aurantiaca]|uniref:NAD(P)-dependent oxidoreductase n=1 Tax=Demequina aurantiaca TaxID=676200 RepID=UPI0007829659|nr:NAD(P)H-binding protein [Demequina aurantiaca]